MGLLACTLLFLIIPCNGAEDWDTNEEEKCAGTKTTITTTCAVAGSVLSYIPYIGDIISSATDICGNLVGELMDCESISSRLDALQDDVTEVLDTVKNIEVAVSELTATLEIQQYVERFDMIDMAKTLQHYTFEYNRILADSEYGAIVVDDNNYRAKNWIGDVLDHVGKVNTDLAFMLNGMDIFIDNNNANIYEVAAKHKVCNFELYGYVTGMILEASTMFLIATRLSFNKDFSVDFHDVAAMLDFNTYAYRKACSLRDFPSSKVGWNFNEKPLQIKAKSTGSKEVDIQLYGSSNNYIGEFTIFSPSNRYAREKPAFILKYCSYYGNYQGFNSQIRWRELPEYYRERTWTIQFGDDYLLVHCGGKRIWYEKLDGSCKSRYGGKVKEIKPNWSAPEMSYNAEFPIASSILLKHYEDKTWNMRYENWTPVVGYTNYAWSINTHPISIKTRDGIESTKYLKIYFRRMIKEGSNAECVDEKDGCDAYTSSYFDFAPNRLCEDMSYLSTDECEVYAKVFTNHPLSGEINNRCYNYGGLRDWYNTLKPFCKRSCGRCYSDSNTYTRVEVYTGPNPKYTILGCKSNVPFDAENVNRAKNVNGDNIWTFEVDPIGLEFLTIKYRDVEMVKFNFATDSDEADKCLQYWTVPKDMGRMYMGFNMGDVKVKHEMMSVYSIFKETYQKDRDALCRDAPTSGHWCNN